MTLAKSVNLTKAISPKNIVGNEAPNRLFIEGCWEVRRVFDHWKSWQLPWRKSATSLKEVDDDWLFDSGLYKMGTDIQKEFLLVKKKVQSCLKGGHKRTLRK